MISFPKIYSKYQQQQLLRSNKIITRRNFEKQFTIYINKVEKRKKIEILIFNVSLHFMYNENDIIHKWLKPLHIDDNTILKVLWEIVEKKLVERVNLNIVLNLINKIENIDECIKITRVYFQELDVTNNLFNIRKCLDTICKLHYQFPIYIITDIIYYLQENNNYNSCIEIILHIENRIIRSILVEEIIKYSIQTGQHKEIIQELENHFTFDFPYLNMSI